MGEFNWKDLVKTIAPTLATALGGPLAGVAVGALSKAVLGDEKGTEESLSKAILEGQNPEMLLKLKEAENAFIIKLKELDLDLERINSGDRDSARKREMEVKDHTPRNLAYGFTVGYFIVLYLNMVYSLNINERALGILDAALIGIITYYFGSSHGSQFKNSIIKEMKNESGKVS